MKTSINLNGRSGMHGRLTPLIKQVGEYTGYTHSILGQMDNRYCEETQRTQTWMTKEEEGGREAKRSSH